MQNTSRRKFQEGQWVRVNKKAKGDSWFLGHVGRIVGFVNTCYDVEFLIPGNHGRELRRLKGYKLNRTRRRS